MGLLKKRNLVLIVKWMQGRFYFISGKYKAIETT
jgi:hypothetical protein